MYSYTLDLILLYLAFTWSLNSCASQPRLAPRALRARHTLLGLRSLSTSDPPELLRSSGHLTLNPSDSSQNSFHPCLASVNEPGVPVRPGEDHRRSQAEGPRARSSQDWWCRGVGCLREPERERAPKDRKQRESKTVLRVETSEQETERGRGNRSKGDGG